MGIRLSIKIILFLTDLQILSVSNLTDLSLILCGDLSIAKKLYAFPWAKLLKIPYGLLCSQMNWMKTQNSSE